jgi:hypothetical protein
MWRIAERSDIQLCAVDCGLDMWRIAERIDIQLCAVDCGLDMWRIAGRSDIQLCAVDWICGGLLGGVIYSCVLWTGYVEDCWAE